MSRSREYQVSLANSYAWTFIGLPYIWGGDDPVRGFDCSGLCVEVLKGVGILPRDGDWGAAALYDKFPHVAAPVPGCLVFYGDGKVEHVEWCYNTSIAIGASGGGSKTQTEQDAIAQNAYVKMRPIARARKIVGYCDPFA